MRGELQMFATKLAAAAGMAVLGLAASVGVAQAAPAYATGNVNVRSGPSTGYAVVDVLRRGDRVDVERCRGSWCYVSKPGPNGWVSANYLSNYDDGYERPPIIVRPPPVIVRPPVYRPPHHWPRPHWPDRHHGRHHGHDRDHGWPDRDRDGASFCYNGPNGYFCLGN
jgi:uncharacterized protein YraI